MDEIINGIPQTGLTGTIVSVPTNEDELRITRIIVNKSTGKVTVEYEDET